MNGDAECPACGWTYGEVETEAEFVPVRSPQPTTTNLPVVVVLDQHHGAREEILPTLSNDPVLPVREVWFEVAAVMCIGFLPHVADAFLLLNQKTYPYWEYASHMTIHAFASIFATLYIIHRSGESWREFGIGWPRFSDGVLGFMLMVVMWYFGSIVYHGVKDSLAPEEGISGLPESYFEFVLLPIMDVLAAFAEEVIMRCYLITRLRQLTHQPWLCVPISAFMFALYHSYQGVPGFAHALFVGVLLGSMFVVYPRIWPLVISHAAYNITLELDSLRQH
jgi:membrane protease YdiL (CAAX protease family)